MSWLVSIFGCKSTKKSKNVKKVHILESISTLDHVINSPTRT